MTQTQSTQGQYNAGYDAAVAAIATLEGQVDAETMRLITIQNIIPVEHSTSDMFRTGQSTAWADYQATNRLEARKVSNRRYWASQKAA